MCLRKRDMSLGTIYRNCATTNLNAGSACPQTCFQVTFKRVEKHAFDVPRILRAIREWQSADRHQICDTYDGRRAYQ
jgi:hypothetical protein